MRLIKIFILISALFHGVLNSATVTQTDDFESGSKNGWSDDNTEIVDYPSPVDSNTLKITSENVWVSKIYDFGSQNANSQATIDLDLWAIGGWESWGPAKDFVYIEINGVMVVNRETITGANRITEEVMQHYNFTVSTDSSGKIEIKIMYEVSDPDKEYLLLDDVKVSIDSNLTFYAADDNYATPPDNPVVENVLANDFGQGIHVISHTDPANGTLTISFDGNFTYTPSAGFIGTDTFTYTIQDENNNTDSATVTIEVQTQLSEGKLLPFSLINPPNTRNIIGDYKIAGNTVLCLTELTSGYGGTCHGEGDYQDITSNMHVTKYLDIDNDPSTWNSTSSYIEVPDTFDPDRGVIWAGLFWQGRISVDKDYPIRYGIEEENTYDLIEVGNGTTITIDRFDIMQSGAVDIKLKINSSDYNDVIANTFHVFESDNGQTYAAYADVTNLFSTNRLQVGKNTFTVANLTTMEGREPSPGAFGGWSLVVIYAEDYTKGSPKNISIYNGFISIDETNDPIEISGFKLPENGDIKAQLSVFSGEGEYRYGRTPYNSAEDWMKISDNEDSGYDYMPGLPSGTDVGNRDNMFDARLNNILRDEFVNGIRNSFSTNNVGVDVDNYDISELMTQYRDNNPDVNSVYIQMYSDNDYITPSMMAFSSELYIPNICYDYTFDIDGYVLDSAENDVNTTLHTLAPNKPLRTHLLIRSLEGDFPLENAEFSVTVKDPTMAKYISGSAMQAIYNINEYEPAGDLVHNESDAGFNLYFGEGATPDHGGTMYANQSNYILFDYETNQSKPRLETTFYFDVNFTVDYGSGPVTIYKQLNADSRCPTSTVYEPEWGIFNVISDPTKPTTYNLITQVSGRPFDIHGIFYDADYTTPKSIKTGVEIEVINANFFKSDTNASCNNPDSNTTEPIYVMFNNSSTTASIQNNPDFALRNSAFRIWYLENNESKLVENTCTTREDEICMKALYDSKFASFDTMCKTACDGTQTPGTCYGCLKKYHAKPLCSRDNFSIRPETFKIYIGDNNQNVDSLPVQVAINDTVNQTNLSADYDYLMSLTATRYNTNEESKRYIQAFAGDYPANNIENSTALGIVEDFPANKSCSDEFNRTYDTVFWDGSAATILSHNNIGEYRLFIRDYDWTAVDNPGKWGQDCIANDSSAGAEGMVGCVIASAYDTTHQDMNLFFKVYDFNLSAVTITAPNERFIYANNLTEDQNMSIKIKGAIVAKGKNGTTLTNFSKGCYGSDLNLTFARSLNPIEENLKEYSKLRYYDMNSSETNTTDIKDVDKIVSTRSNLGTATANLAINVDRNSSRPINPIDINITEVKVTCSDAQDCSSYADQSQSYVAEGNLTLANPFSRFIYYGRLHAPNYRTAENSIETPVYPEVYCDPIEVNCDDFNISRANGWKESVDSANWWINPYHNAANDGNITKITAITSTGIDDNIKIEGTTSPYIPIFNSNMPYSPEIRYVGANRPYRARLEVDTQNWLKYHRYFSDGRIYYDIIFEGSGDWAGIGETGQTVDTNASSTTSRRIEW